MKLSATKIKCYKACKKKFFFSYIEGLSPITKAQPLEDGISYHGMIEALYKTGELELDLDNPKISAMAMAYKMFIYPQFKVKCVEEWFEFLVGEHTFIGRFDGIAEDGCVVEHKTTSMDIDEEYIYGLQWDEQILAYMIASGKNEMYYTVCKKPTIRQKQNESNIAFYERCIMWYCEDTDKKIRVIKVTRHEREIEAYRAELNGIADSIELDDCVYSGLSDTLARDRKESVYYRNPSYCTAYNRRCEYASICLDYDPKLEYVEFQKTKIQ